LKSIVFPNRHGICQSYRKTCRLQSIQWSGLRFIRTHEQALKNHEIARMFHPQRSSTIIKTTEFTTTVSLASSRIALLRNLKKHEVTRMRRPQCASSQSQKLQ
jgi:hypothetical protein